MQFKYMNMAVYILASMYLHMCRCFHESKHPSVQTGFGEDVCMY